MTKVNYGEYVGPKVPDHLASGLGDAGRKVLQLWIESELARLEIRCLNRN